MPSKKRVIFTTGNTAILGFQQLKEFIGATYKPLRSIGAAANLREIYRMFEGSPEFLGLSVFRDKQHYRKSRRPYLLMLERTRSKKEKKRVKVHPAQRVISGIAGQPSQPRPPRAPIDWSTIGQEIGLDIETVPSIPNPSPGPIRPAPPAPPSVLDPGAPHRSNFSSFSTWLDAYRDYEERVLLNQRAMARSAMEDAARAIQPPQVYFSSPVMTPELAGSIGVGGSLGWRGASQYTYYTLDATGRMVPMSSPGASTQNANETPNRDPSDNS